tara:strand:+ start:63 stop:599 length:537 start_codon:yes stop_codon:yes gene_type:complete
MFRILIVFLLISFSVNADQYDKRLKNLFNQLLITDDEKIISRITLDIWDIWHETNDPKINSDFFKGIGLMNNGNLEMSIIYFTKVIKNNASFAEAWNKRATAYYMLGEFDKSMNDIKVTLKLEPRHFGALDGMVLIFLHQKKYEQAIEIYEEILKIFPKSKSTFEKKQILLDYISKSV